MTSALLSAPLLSRVRSSAVCPDSRESLFTTTSSLHAQKPAARSALAKGAAPRPAAARCVRSRRVRGAARILSGRAETAVPTRPGPLAPPSSSAPPPRPRCAAPRARSLLDAGCARGSRRQAWPRSPFGCLLACLAAQNDVVKAINGDPFIGMFETPVTSSPLVANLLSNLPAYRTGVSPLLRGVEIGLTHGFFVAGPFIKLGPLRATEVAEVAGSLSAAGLVLILTAALSIYGAVSFQQPEVVGVKTLSGRSIARDPLQTSEGWAQFSSGWLVGGLSGVAWAYILTQVLPYYS